MKRLALMALALLPALAGCAVDRGTCLSGHVEHSDAAYIPVMSPVFGPNGQTSWTVTTQYIPESDSVVCDRWEFPEGRPEKGR